MEIVLAYGGGSVSVEVPPHVQVETFLPASAERTVTFEDFRSEIEATSSGAFFAQSAPLFIVNDAYRHTPTVLVLDWLERLYPGLLNRSEFLIATGSHKPPTEPQLRSIFIERYEQVRARVTWHQATESGLMTKVGTDSFGSAVSLNQKVLGMTRPIIIGSVEPHYFAGYTGGRKALFPGLVDLATIERNHNLANSMEAAPLRLEGNPVAEHLQSLTTFIDLSRFLSIQLVADSKGRIAGIFAGDLNSSLERAVPLANKLFSHSISEPFDAVLCEMHSPLDSSIYQAQKGLENCQAGVADGGLAVVIARCEEGAGSDFFVRQAENWDSDHNSPRDGVYQFGSHKLKRMVTLQRRIDARLYSNAPDELARKVFYHPAGNLTELIKAKSKSQNKFRLAVVHDAGNTVLTAVAGKK